MNRKGCRAMEIREFLGQNLTEYQSIPFWSWNDELDPEELRRQIRQMKEAGIGGFFMHARGGLTTEYLGEDWFRATAACIDEARRQGMDAWCYDENGWPSGFAGMKLLKDPANFAHYLAWEESAVFDPKALAAYIVKDHRLHRVTSARDEEQTYILIYDRTNSSVVDILNPAIVKKFLNETHEKYFSRFGKDFGRVMKGFFTDEPQYFRWDTAYTPLMLKEYQAVYGEDLLDELGALFVDCEQSSRLRYRYWKLMNALYTVHFARQIYDWCQAHGCQLTGHTIDETSLFGQIMCSGGVMPFYQYEHKPGIDWLGRKIGSEMTPRQVSSVAQQMGKKHVLTETFACAGWDVTPRELKRIAEWQYVHGVNQMCQHLYPYSIRGQRKRDYPAFYSPHNPWTQPEEFRHFNDYFTALGFLLSESREAADVAVIHPIHSAYLTFQRKDRHSCDALNGQFQNLVEKLGAAHIGHHYVDESLLAQHGGVSGDALTVGKCAYHFVVLPEMPCLDASTAAILKKFLRQGGRLYLAGKAPYLVDGEPADLSFLQSNVTFRELLSPEYQISDLDTPIRATLRRAPFGRFLFSVNLSEDTACSVTYRFQARGAELFDLETRKTKPLFFKKESGTEITVPLTFAPGQSYVIVLNDAALPADPPAAALPAWRSLALEGQILSGDENTWTLDTAALSLDGENYTLPLPIMAVSDRMLRGKTNRDIFLRYTFSVGEKPGKLRLECEKMGAKAVFLNGVPLPLSGPGTLDPAFVSGDLTPLVRVGENELVFHIAYVQSQAVYDVFNGVYYEHSDGTESLINCLSYQTDLEAVYLRGDFAVQCGKMTPGAKNTLITREGFSLARRPDFVRADALVSSGYPFFGGKITLRFRFEASGNETAIRLRGRFAIAKARLNGGKETMLLFGDTLHAAGQIKAGENLLDITLYSSYRNLMGPFHYAPDPEPFSVSPNLFSGYGTWREDGTSENYTSAYAFVRFGLDKLEIR